MERINAVFSMFSGRPMRQHIVNQQENNQSNITLVKRGVNCVASWSYVTMNRAMDIAQVIWHPPIIILLWQPPQKQQQCSASSLCFGFPSKPVHGSIVIIASQSTAAYWDSPRQRIAPSGDHRQNGCESIQSLEICTNTTTNKDKNTSQSTAAYWDSPRQYIAPQGDRWQNLHSNISICLHCWTLFTVQWTVQAWWPLVHCCALSLC